MYRRETDPVPPLTETQLEQIRAAGKKGAAARAAQTKCAHGHYYTLENTYFSPTGKRECRICRRERKRKEHANKKREIQETYVRTFTIPDPPPSQYYED